MHPNIQFATIDRGNRVRIDHGNIKSLAEDAFVNGLIHPICISQSRILIAGGRRSCALDYILANYEAMVNDPELGTPHPDIVHLYQSGELIFGRTYTYKDVIDLGDIAELELIENVQRHNFTWQEEVIAIHRIHTIRVQQNAMNRIKWTQQQTGRLVNKSRANVHYCLELATHLKDTNSPIWKCCGVMEALQYLTKLRHDEASKLLAESIKSKAPTLPTARVQSTPSADITQFVQRFDPTQFNPSATIASPSDEFGPPPPPKPVAESKAIIDANQKLIEESMQVATQIVHNLDCLEFFKMLGKESVDCVLTDPPYGIEMKNVKQSNQGQKDIDRIADTHDVEENMEMFPLWLQGCFDILKPKGFCVWFCDQAQWQYLYDLAIKVGFKVQRWPFVWVKTTSCMNQRAEYNFTKATEIAMVMRKGDARLVSAQQTNYWMGGNTPEDKAAGVNHPFIKPRELWQHLLKAIALPGSRVAEPFSGVGSGTRAMLLAGYTPVSCELDEAHYAQQVNNIAKEYCKLNGVEF